MHRANERLGATATTLLALLLVIGLALGYWQIVRAGSLVNDQKINQARLYVEEQSIQRGRLLDRDGTVLAQTDMSKDGPSREYKTPSLVHVTGRYSLRYGNTNVERTQDSLLRGVSGGSISSIVESQLLHRPTVGGDVTLSINSKLQLIADQALGDDTGAIIVMNPRTGEILALASHPYYDPNSLEQDWSKLLSASTTPLINRATQGLYVPGSTFKTLTLAAALEYKQATTSEVFRFSLSGQPASHSELFNGFQVTCANHRNASAGPLAIDLAEAYASSCNVAFAEMGVRVGPKRLADLAESFGFGQELPVDLETSASRLYATPRFLQDDAALAATAFGQGELLVTPLQMALITNAVANGGAVMEPYVATSGATDGSVVWTRSPREWRRPFSASTAEIVRSIMIKSVEDGWAEGAKISGVLVGGKTGTAETGTGQGTHAWFTGFAPGNDPRVSIVVIKEHAGFGSAAAVPAGKQVLEAALGLVR